LPSRIRKKTGGLAFRNSEAALKALVEAGEKAQKMNSSFQQHL
jgi:hypothetical protein